MARSPPRTFVVCLSAVPPPSSLALNLPTPVRLLRAESNRELWVKDDGKIESDYGGNKPRKLAYLLADEG